MPNNGGDEGVPEFGGACFQAFGLSSPYLLEKKCDDSTPL